MKYAFLIIAHDRPAELMRLLAALDYADNDIYVHLDSKSTCFSIRDLEEQVHKSGLYFAPRLDITWGGQSQIQAELNLFSMAYNHGGYRYYHLLSGVDYPVKSQEYIHDFFKKEDGKNFISLKDIDDVSPRFRMRFEQYHLFHERFVGKKRNIWKYIDFACCYMQKMVGVRRFKQRPMKRHSNWISVTDEVIELIVRNQKRIAKEYRWTYCCDEVFLLSEIWDTPLRETLSSKGNLRYMEWVQITGRDWSPRSITERDIDVLSDPDILFARKFTLPESKEIYNYLEHEFLTK